MTHPLRSLDHRCLIALMSFPCFSRDVGRILHKSGVVCVNVCSLDGDEALHVFRCRPKTFTQKLGHNLN